MKKLAGAIKRRKEVGAQLQQTGGARVPFGFVCNVTQLCLIKAGPSLAANRGPDSSCCHDVLTCKGKAIYRTFSAYRKMSNTLDSATLSRWPPRSS